MQEQQQAYKAASHAKAHTQQLYAQPQIIPPYAVQAPVYFTKPALAVAVRPTPQVIQAPIRPAAPQAQCPRAVHTPQALMEAASTLQEQFQAFLQQLNQPHNNVPRASPLAQAEGSSSQGASVGQLVGKFTLQVKFKGPRLHCLTQVQWPKHQRLSHKPSLPGAQQSHHRLKSGVHPCPTQPRRCKSLRQTSRPGNGVRHGTPIDVRSSTTGTSCGFVVRNQYPLGQRMPKEFFSHTRTRWSFRQRWPSHLDRWREFD